MGSLFHPPAVVQTESSNAWDMGWPIQRTAGRTHTKSCAVKKALCLRASFFAIKFNCPSHHDGSPGEPQAEESLSGAIIKPSRLHFKRVVDGLLPGVVVAPPVIVNVLVAAS